MTGRRLSHFMETPIERLALIIAVALLTPTLAHSTGFPPIFYFGDQLINGIGYSTSYDEGAMLDLDLGYLERVGEPHSDSLLLIGGLASLGIGDDLTRLAIGPHFRYVFGLSPEFIYRRVDGENEYGGAANLSFNIPFLLFGFAVNTRGGLTTGGSFGEVGFDFSLAWPIGDQPARPSRPPVPPRVTCTQDADCAPIDQVCNQNICGMCRPAPECESGWLCSDGQCKPPTAR